MGAFTQMVPGNLIFVNRKKSLSISVKVGCLQTSRLTWGANDLKNNEEVTDRSYSSPISVFNCIQRCQQAKSSSSSQGPRRNFDQASHFRFVTSSSNHKTNSLNKCLLKISNSKFLGLRVVGAKYIIATASFYSSVYLLASTVNSWVKIKIVSFVILCEI